MYEGSMNPPKTLRECTNPTRTVRLLSKVADILKVLKFVVAGILALSLFITSIYLSIIFDSFLLFFGSLVGGAAIVVALFFLGWFIEIIFRGFTSSVHSSNVSAKLKYYELSKNTSNAVSKNNSLEEYNRINGRVSETVKEELKITEAKRVCSCGNELRVGAIICPVCGKEV